MPPLRWLARPGRLAYAFVVVLSLVLCAVAAAEHGEAVNRNREDKDQGAYLNLGRRIAEHGRIQVDGARPPLYTAILATVYRPEMPPEEYFERCKRLNIFVTLAGWAVLLPLFRRRLRPLTALTTWCVLGFTVFLFYAPYVKAEGLFYALATWSFLGALSVLHRPHLGAALLFGVVTALAQLTKESMLPGLALFGAVQLLAAAVAAIRLLRRRGRGASFVGWATRRLTLRVLSVPVAVLAFLLVVYPHIRVNKHTFGHHFYNVNSYFYIWYDSWGEVSRGTRRHGDRKGWPDMPPEDLPSASKYWETHSVEEIRQRIVRGGTGVIERSRRSHGFFDYVCYGLLATAVSLASNARLRRWSVRHWPVTVFVVGYVTGYSLMCTWFFAIHPGVRFFVALVAPLAFVGAWLSDRNRPSRTFGTLGFWTMAVAASLLVDLPTILFEWTTSMRSAGW